MWTTYSKHEGVLWSRHERPHSHHVTARKRHLRLHVHSHLHVEKS